LGISVEDEGEKDEEKIYSQSEMDELREQWEREHLAPTLQQLREARRRSGELEAQLRRPAAWASQDSKQSHDKDEEQRKYIAWLAALLGGVADRTVNNDLSGLVTRLAHTLQSGDSDLSSLSRELEQLPFPALDEPAPSSRVFPALDEPAPSSRASLESVTSCLSVVESELRAVAHGLQGGVDRDSGLQSFATWAQDAIASASSALKGSGTAQWGAAPKRNMSSLRAVAMPSRRTASVNTGPELIKHLLEAEVEARHRSMQDQFAAKLNEVQAQADKWKQSWEEVSQRLAEEKARAESLVSELQKKMLDMTKRLKQAGMGKLVEEALEGSVFAGLIKRGGDNVFQRLYRDAQERMRRLAEAQARIFNLTSDSLQKILVSLGHPASLITSAPGTLVTSTPGGSHVPFSRPCSVDMLLAPEKLHHSDTFQQRENSIVSVASLSGVSVLLPRLEFRGSLRSSAGHAGAVPTETPAEHAAPLTSCVPLRQCLSSSRPLSSPAAAAPQRCAHHRIGTLCASRSVPRLGVTVPPSRFALSANNVR